ncbi:MAG: AI-2E family transporter, partial [Candidatus Obscuribacterales bacterium]|nr:AI-2E family transporter [Candidatus Obscuribacterales bacterium]
AALIYGLVAALLKPAISEQWHKLLENLPAYISGIDRWYQKVLSFAGNKPDVFVYEVGDLKTLLPKLLRQTLDMSAGVLGLVLNVVLILFLAGYFAVEADQIWRNTLKWLPENARDRFAKLIAPLSMRLGGYVRGELLVALAVGTFLAIGFAILGLKYALLLGVLGGILNLVPYVGALAATACAVIVAFNQSPALALGVLLFYGLEQWVESSFLVPNLLGKSVALHPLIVLLSILCGASLMGIPGALVSIPITSAAMLIAEEFYLKRSGANDK